MHQLVIAYGWLATSVFYESIRTMHNDPNAGLASGMLGHLFSRNRGFVGHDACLLLQ